MEVRAAATRVAEPVAPPAADAAPVTTTEPRTTRPRAASGRTTARVVARPVAISRDEEYRYIRSDLNRLLVTAGSLLVLMIVLLVLIEM